MVIIEVQKNDYDISLFRRIKSKYRRLCFLSYSATRCVAAVMVTLVVIGPSVHAQSGLQRLDERILEDLAAGRTDGQTRLWRFVSNANNYVNAGIPLGVLADGLIRNDDRIKRNGLYMVTSTATTYVL